jgi:hypothetical protein
MERSSTISDVPGLSCRKYNLCHSYIDEGGYYFNGFTSFFLNKRWEEDKPELQSH